MQIILKSENEWLAFLGANRDGIEAEGYSADSARNAARRGLLTLGGGAAPLVEVVLVEESSK